MSSTLFPWLHQKKTPPKPEYSKLFFRAQPIPKQGPQIQQLVVEKQIPEPLKKLEQKVVPKEIQSVPKEEVLRAEKVKTKKPPTPPQKAQSEPRKLDQLPELPGKYEKQVVLQPVAPSASAYPPVSHDQISRAVAEVLAAIEKYKKYPKAARQAGYGGVVKLRILVTTEGRVAECSIAESSGRKTLDQAAIKAARKILEKKVVSVSLADDLAVSVPVRFFLK